MINSLKLASLEDLRNEESRLERLLTRCGFVDAEFVDEMLREVREELMLRAQPPPAPKRRAVTCRHSVRPARCASPCSTLAVGTCSFELRGSKAGQVCGKKTCGKHGEATSGQWLCAAHVRWLMTRQ